MKIRETGYDDYGFEDGEAKRLLEYCRGNDFHESELLRQCAASANPCIVDELCASIAEGKSYERLSQESYVPISKDDFYGYRRKCMRIFLNFLLFCGKWGTTCFGDENRTD